jgi:hypothetical protein
MMLTCLPQAGCQCSIKNNKNTEGPRRCVVGPSFCYLSFLSEPHSPRENDPKNGHRECQNYAG